MTKYLVIDNDWNREHCPNWIGQVFDYPPSYVIVDAQMSDDDVDGDFFDDDVVDE